MSSGLKKAIKGIKTAGFSHIKVELEAELGREDSDEERYESCTECDGDGYLPLFTSAGVKVDETTLCEECDGEGQIEQESYTNFADEDDCQEYIMNHVSKEARESLNYIEFYNDGSVDSEVTFTLPVDKVEYVPEFIAAFSALADEIGNGMDVDGAGMHVSVLTSGNYPTYDRLPVANIRNFKSEVTKLLPALFLTATSGDFTRGLSYRYPRIANDEKYSAIYTHGDTCLEYRLFETCYQRPDAFFEYIGTIARTLEYYTNVDKKVVPLHKDYSFYNGAGMGMLIDSPEQVSVIKQQLSKVKPDGYTIKQMLADRGVDLSIVKARKKSQGKIKELKLAYKEHKKAYETLMSRELTQFEKDNIEWVMNYENMTYEQAKSHVINPNGNTLEDEPTFINSNFNTRSASFSVAV